MDQRSDVLMQRLERLERSHRRLKLLTLVVFVAIGTMGAAKEIPKTFNEVDAKLIKAEGIMVVDANGNLRVAIGADPASEQAGMTVYQRDGITRVEIGANAANNAAATFSDPSGTNLAAMAELTNFPRPGNNGSIITTFGPTGQAGPYLLAVPADGVGQVVAANPNGITFGGSGTGLFQSGPSGTFLTLNRASGTSAIELVEAPDDSTQTFNMHDSNNTQRVAIGSNATVENMQIFGPDSNIRATMESGSSSNNGKVETFDSSGAPTGTLGGP